MFAESSSPAETNQRARIISKEMKATEGQCLSFWYNMYGKDTGALKVYLKSADGLEQVIWDESGDKGNKWIQASKSIVSQTNYKVINHLEVSIDYISSVDLLMKRLTRFLKYQTGVEHIYLIKNLFYVSLL